MSDFSLESPLHHSKRLDRSNALPHQAAVILSERVCDHINLRGDASDPAWPQAVNNALGFALPLKPNTFSTAAADNAMIQQALWLSPDEWLLLAPAGTATAALATLRSALATNAKPSALIDLSSGQTVIRLAGTHAREVLSKGCTLDLHPSRFGPSRCAQTLLAKTAVLLWQQAADDNSAVFDIAVRRSFADYCWHWLEDAAAEYGFAVLD